MVNFSSKSLFPVRKREVVTRLKTDGRRSPEAEDNPGKSLSSRLGREARPQADSRYILAKQQHTEKTHIYILLLKGNHSRQHSKYYIVGQK